MFTALYTTGFILLLVFMVLVFAVKSRQVKMMVSGGFLISLLLYVLGFFFESGNILYKLLIVLPRDLAVFTILLFLVNKWAPRPKWLYFSLAILAAFFKFWYYDTLQKSFDFSDLDHSEFLIEVKDSDDYSQLWPILETWKLVMEPAFPIIAFPDNTTLDEYFTVNIPSKYLWFTPWIELQLSQNEGTQWIERNEVVTTSLNFGKDYNEANDVFTNDPLLNKQWGLYAIGAPKVHQWISEKGIKPKKKVILAILDTGADINHEDLNSNISASVSEEMTDKLGHGTHCAGIVGAVSGNGKGVASLIPSGDWIEILPIKVLEDNGSGTQRRIIDGIIQAVDAGATVLSLSLGGVSQDSEQRAYREAIEYAEKAGAIVIVAAGNSGDDAKFYAPANVEGVLAVAATDQHTNPASFTNSIKNIRMGIAAPGVDIFSTFPGHEYKSLNGTSMATPFVSSTVALMKALKPDLTAHQAYLILLQKGQSTGDLDKTGPLIDAYESVLLLTKK